MVAFLLIILCLAMLIAGIYLLKQTANKFNLSEEKLARIKKRNAALEKEEQEDENN